MSSYRELIAEDQGVCLADVCEEDYSSLSRAYHMLNRLSKKFRDGKIKVKLLKHQGKRIWKIIDNLEGR